MSSDATGAVRRQVRDAPRPRGDWLRQALLLVVIFGAAIVVLMFAVDAWEISLMPPRGTASLWPVRIFTDFGKAALVLWALAACCSRSRSLRRDCGEARDRLLLEFGTHLQFLFFAVLVPVLAGEVIKWIVGRGRPFVGGEANAFNFSHFAGTEAYASFPSAHAITSFALAFAVSAVWPRARIPMIAVCGPDRGQPPRAAGPSSQRRGRRRIDRGGRRDGRAVLVRRAPPGVHHCSRRRNCAVWPDLCRELAKGLPARRQPHKKRTP